MTVEQKIYGPDAMPMAAYVADPCPEPSLSKGTIRDILYKSLAHAHLKHPRFGNAQSESKEMDFGSAMHGFLMGGEKSVVFLDFPDWRKKEAREQRDDARANNQIPMLTKDKNLFMAMTVAAQPFLDEIGPMLLEQSLFWQEHGLWHRSRPDMLSEDFKVYCDYKTTTNADPAFCSKSVVTQNGYDIQAALVRRGLNHTCGPDERRKFLWLFQEKKPPFACSFVGMGNEMYEIADQKITAGQRIWKKAVQNDEFPGYGTDIYWADPPPWSVSDFEDRAATYELRGLTK